MSMNRRSALRGIAGALAAAATPVAATRLAQAAQAEATPTVIRMAPSADLKILDPVWTTAIITRDHGYMIYDTLFGQDTKGQIHPQMVDTFHSSADGKEWSFTLRPGLAFHDGKPVTSADVVQSLKRWSQRDAIGQLMFAQMAEIKAVDANTFTMSFKETFGPVLEALSKPSTNTPFIMPERVALTPADKQFSDTTGSGPFIFSKDEFRPGNKAVYLKNTKYVPRKEPASGTAGGKVVHVDRMEWLLLKDPQTQASALRSGQIDLIQSLPAEQYTAMKSDPNVLVTAQQPAGAVTVHMNELQPPFDNPKVRQAAIMAINQAALMRAQQIYPELYKVNTSIYPSGSTYANNKTSYFTGKPQFEKARALLKEAGYDGKPVLLMWPADYAILNKYPPVMAALLKQAGFNVDLQSMDWPTLVTRRAKKDPVAAGGWNMFITGWSAADQMNPLYFAPVTGNGDQGWFGWPKDEKIEDLKKQFVAATDPAQKKTIATQIQEEVYNAGIFAPLGERTTLVALRKDRVQGLVLAPVSVYWGLKRV